MPEQVTRSRVLELSPLSSLPPCRLSIQREEAAESLDAHDTEVPR
jgi:hypothetical protein